MTDNPKDLPTIRRQGASIEPIFAAIYARGHPRRANNPGD